jgi:hypothetical protein
MFCNDVYKCDSCGAKTEVDRHYSPNTCSCGGTFQKTGEHYDQEFVDEERYNEQQDKEYEDRHRNDRW